MGRERMSSVDTAWLRMDSDGNLMMIVGVHVFDTPIPRAAMARLIEERLLRYDRFRQRVEHDAAGATWVDDPHFSLDYHLQSVALVEGGDAGLQALVGELASTPLDPARPLWQFHLVSGYDGGCAMITRIHHCIADGIALVGVLLSLTDERPPMDAPARDPSQAHADHDEHGWDAFLKPLTQGAIRAIEATGVAVERSLDVVANPEKLGDYAVLGTQVVKDALKIALMTSDSATSLKGVPTGRKSVAWNEPLPLDEVKAVGRAIGGSVNDVLLSCVAGAIRRYLLSRGESVDGCEIRAMVPVNLRGANSGLSLGNKFGLVPLVLPVGIGNPLARVREVRRRMDELKGGFQALLAFALLGIVGRTPRLVQTQILNILARKGTAVMTNVPGPAKPLHMAGATMSRVMFWVPQSGDIGMGVSILSYGGGVQFGVITDRVLCDDPRKIIEGFAPEFERLVMTLALLPPSVLQAGDWDPDDLENQLFDTLAEGLKASAGTASPSGRDAGAPGKRASSRQKSATKRTARKTAAGSAAASKATKATKATKAVRNAVGSRRTGDRVHESAGRGAGVSAANTEPAVSVTAQPGNTTASAVGAGAAVSTLLGDGTPSTEAAPHASRDAGSMQAPSDGALASDAALDDAQAGARPAASVEALQE